MSENTQICSRCIYDSKRVPRITFDENGVCNYCHIHDDLDAKNPAGEEGERRLQKLAGEIRNSARGKKYDCVVGVSGGCDSSYLVKRLVDLGLRPLAAHFDNTWNSPIATQNIYTVLDKLGVDLETYVVDNQEYDDIQRSILLSGIQHVEAATDLGLAAVLYQTAEKHGLKYIIEGHSFRTEGVSVLDWAYMDGRFIRSIHRQFGKLPMKTYPLMTLSRFLKWTVISGIRRVRPLYYMSYPKEEVKKMLSEKYGWEWYGGHHLENRYTSFKHLYVMPQRWNADLRILGHAALVRSGQLDRETALDELNQPVECPDDLLRLVKKRLRFSDEEFDAVMNLPRKSWKDYPNYKKTFERLRPLFAILVKTGRVPESFYMKFCFPNELGENPAFQPESREAEAAADTKPGTAGRPQDATTI